MQTSDRSRIARSLGLAVAALLLVGGAVFGSNALIGGSRTSDATQPSASADVNDREGQDASESPDTSESPEASADETAGETLNEAVNDEHTNGNASPEASDAETEMDNESEAPGASESPDQGGGDSGHG